MHIAKRAFLRALAVVLLCGAVAGAYHVLGGGMGTSEVTPSQAADMRTAASRLEDSVAPASGGPQARRPTVYRLGPGDKLRIIVFGHKDISGQFVIDGSGNIAMPLLGQFAAGGLTVTELEKGLQTALNKNYIVNPRVSVEVLNYRPFFILGEVNRPGSYPYITGITVLQAVALGGGYTRRARTSTAEVTRVTPDGRVTLSLGPEAPVLPGDTIEVGRRLF